MESKYQEEESIGKELDSTEVLKNNELEPTTEPPPGLEGRLDATNKSNEPEPEPDPDPDPDANTTPDPIPVIIKPFKEKNKFAMNRGVRRKSNELEPESDLNPEPDPTLIPPVIIIKPEKN